MAVRSSIWHSPTMRPARRIASSSCRFFNVGAIYNPNHHRRHQRYFALPIDLDQIPLLAIIFDQRHRLSKIDLYAVASRLHRIVATLVELPTALITHFRLLRWEIVYIIGRAAGFASLPAGDAPEQHDIGYIQKQHVVDPPAVVHQLLLERERLIFR